MTPLPRLPSLPDASPSDDDSGSQSSGKSTWWKMQKSKVGYDFGAGMAIVLSRQQASLTLPFTPVMSECLRALKMQLRHKLKSCLCRHRLLLRNRRRMLSWIC